MKSRRVKNINERVEAFAKGADVASSESRAVFRRYTFSLTEDVSDKIDDMTILAKRVTRSDVIKAGLKAFDNLKKSEQIALLAEVKNQE